MYTIHTTSGLIIDSRPRGEAGKLISVFTKEMGLVMAVAQGIRLEKSKLRCFTQDHIFGLFSFVKGKELWRLTNAEELEDSRLGAQILCSRMSSLLKRLLHGEEAHPELFDSVLSAVKFLEKNREKENRELDMENMKSLESLAVVRILYHLGYIGNDDVLSECFKSNDINIGLLNNVRGKRGVINQHINKALRESHL